MNASKNSIFLRYHRLWIYFRFPETNFFFKDLKIQVLYTVDYESSSELIEWQSPQMQYMCTHPRKQNKTLYKKIYLIFGVIVPNYDPSTRP